MKKINGLLILGLASVLSLVVACEQEGLQEITPQNENVIESRNTISIADGVSLVDRRLVFEDRETFEDFMHYLESIDVEDFLQSLPSDAFESLYNQTGILLNGEEINEEELLTVLSEYGSLQIGDYVIRLNFETAEAYMIPVSAGTEEVIRMEREGDPDDPTSWPGASQIVPFDQNVFDIIEDENNVADDDVGGDDDQQALSLCNAASGDADSDNAKESCDPRCDNAVGTISAQYGGFAIWFSMSATFSYSSCFGLCSSSLSHTLFVDASWNVCGPGNVGSEDSAISADACFSTNTVYSGTRRLKSFDLTADATYSCRGSGFSTPRISIGG